MSWQITGERGVRGTTGTGWAIIDAYGEVKNVVYELLYQAAPYTPATPPAGYTSLYAVTNNGHTQINQVDEGGTVLRVNRDSVLIVRNTSGSSLPRATVVTFTGATAGVGNVGLADADTFALHADGLLFEGIANNAYGLMVAVGQLSSLNTNGLVEGGKIYLSSTAGAYTQTAPTSPATFQEIGTVVRAHATQGVIEVSVNTALQSISGAAMVSSVIQTTHGFAVGDVVYLNGGTYTKAIASSAATAEVVGIVTTITDANTFSLTAGGKVSGLTGLTAGTVYFLSGSSAGALTSVEPTTTNYVSKPLLIADTTTSGYFFNMRGMVVGAVMTASQEDEVFDSISTVIGDSPTIQWDHDAEGSARLVANLNPITPANTNTGFYSASKNACINGAFEVWQRGTSFAGAASGSYAADRWVVGYSTAGVLTLTRDTDIPTVAQAGLLAPYSLKADVTTADASLSAADYFLIEQKIEGYVWRNFAQRNLTLSFWVKSTKTGVFSVAFLNSGADRCFVSTYTVNASDTWEKKTINVTASPSAGTWLYTTGVGCRVIWSLMGSTDYQTSSLNTWNANALHVANTQVNALDSTANNFFLALVQLEVGDVATDFDFVPFDRELERCQRYYEKSFAYATAPAQNVGANVSEFTWPSQAGFVGQHAPQVSYKVRKRGSPTITTYNPAATNAQARNYTTAADASNMAVTVLGEMGFRFTITGDAGAAGDGAHVFGVNWTSDAEI